MNLLSVQDLSGDAIPAPKTFYIFPDPTLVSDTFLEVAFLRGYECYSIPGLLGADYEQVVEAIVNAFEASVLFFFIEKDEPIDFFVRLLEGIQNRYSDTVRLGVFYKKRGSKQEEQAVQLSFLYDIGIERDASNSRILPWLTTRGLLNVLAANEVAGRRKVIRMPDESQFRAELMVDDAIIDSRIIDLSVTHFTVQMSSLVPSWKIGTKLNNIVLNLGETTVEARGVVSLKRVVQSKVVFVIRFHSKEGKDEQISSVVNRIIYKYYQKRTMDFIYGHFGQVHKGL